MKLKKPDINGTVGIICPSYSISGNNPKIALMEKRLHDFGFSVRFGKSFYSSYGYLAGDDELRARDLETMFADDGISIILCMLGGYGASRMVDKIDYGIIRKHPKPFIGFSDVTVLLNAITERTGIPTVHGLVGIYLGSPDLDAFSAEDFRKLLFENQRGRILKNPDDSALTLVPGCAEGELAGGNLSLITALTGTGYDVDFTDKIVFLEDVDEEPYRIDRYLSTLRLAQKLESAKGFVFGKFANCKAIDRKEWNYLDIIRQYMKDIGKPVLAEFASGHSFPFINLPIGLTVRLDAEEKTLTIMEEMYETH